MATPRQIEANRRNALKGTGPRTAEGKGRSRFNALKHGMTAETPVLPGEDEGAYQKRIDAWKADFPARGWIDDYLEQIDGVAARGSSRPAAMAGLPGAPRPAPPVPGPESVAVREAAKAFLRNEVAIWELTRRGVFSKERTIPLAAAARGCVVASVPG